ncbi:MAG: TOBE domain-containing protein [Paracoccaceae bacterium]
MLAIRPEKFSQDAKKPEGDLNSVQGELNNATYLGERSHYYVRIKGVEQTVAVSAQNKSRLTNGLDAQVQKVWLSWKDDAVVVLRSE